GDMSRVTLSAVHLPMRARDADGQERLIGVLSAQAYRPDAYTDAQVNALQWLADRAGGALQREQDAAGRRRFLNAAADQEREQRRSLIATREESVRHLKRIGDKAAAFRSQLPPEPALQRALADLIQTCQRSQTEINQLPLALPLPPASSASSSSSAL